MVTAGLPGLGLKDKGLPLSLHQPGRIGSHNVLQNDEAEQMNHPAGKPRQRGAKKHGLWTFPELRANHSSELTSSGMLGSSSECLGF